MDPTPALSAQGTYTLSATQTDAATNIGTAPAQTAVIDKTGPVVTGVSSTLDNGSYRAGQDIPVTVTFNEPVTVTGTPRLTLRTSASATTAVNYVAGNGSTTLTFTYTVLAGHTSADLDYSANNSLALNGGTIRDAAINNATLTLAAPGAAGSLGASKDLVIDTTAPTVTGVTSSLANGSYRAGQVIPVTVTFSEAVKATGTPQLTLATGASANTAVDYTSGTGTNALTFEYTVVAGDTSADLNYAATNSLTLNGGSIADPAGNAGTLTLPALGSANSLGGSKALAIDTTAPVVTVTGIEPQGSRRIRVSGTAEVGAGPVTVYLCANSGSPCDASSADRTFTNVAVGTNGTWRTNYGTVALRGDWYARAVQADAAGNLGSSDVFGPVAN